VLPQEVHRGDMHLTALAAKATIAERWSEFNEPDYNPWVEL
jgi:hypothetical protein